jgi:hypothetical protein
MKHQLTILTAAVAALAILPSPSHANERSFTYTYEVTTNPKGSIEYEQWATWEATRGVERMNEFKFREELEFGLTDHLQLGLYLSDWSVVNTPGSTEAKWEDAGAEFIWNLSNPTTDFLGSALYLETRLGDEQFALEGKVLLQKNFGQLIVAYNAVYEAEWEGPNYDERGGAVEQNLGISYELSPHFSLGAEVFHAMEMEDFKIHGKSALYAGPVASVKYGNWFATTTVLFQTTDREEQPDVQTRLIFGIHF